MTLAHYEGLAIESVPLFLFTDPFGACRWVSLSELDKAIEDGKVQHGIGVTYMEV